MTEMMDVAALPGQSESAELLEAGQPRSDDTAPLHPKGYSPEIADYMLELIRFAYTNYANLDGTYLAPSAHGRRVKSLSVASVANRGSSG